MIFHSNMVNAKYIICILSMLLIGEVNGQNGRFIAKSYKFYNNSEETSETYPGNYIIDISISEYSGQGQILINNETEGYFHTHILTGKTRQVFEPKSNKNVTVYYGSVNMHGISQPESIFITSDPNTNEIECLVFKSIEFDTEGYYCNLTPIEETLPSTGSGFIVSSEGYIITNYHVIKGAKKIIISNVNDNVSETHYAELKNIDIEKDIALLKIKNNNYPINYSIQGKDLDVGEGIFVLGYPMINLMGTEIKLTNGIISSSSGFMNDKSYYQISSPIQPGNSGGPLFSNKGYLIGLITSKLSKGDNVGYALKASYIVDFLSKNGISKPTGTLSTEQTSLPQKIKKLKANVVSIMVVR